MSFAFGFSGDDIEEDLGDGLITPSTSALSAQQATDALTVRAQSHKLEDLVGKALIQFIVRISVLSKSTVVYITFCLLSHSLRLFRVRFPNCPPSILRLEQSFVHKADYTQLATQPSKIAFSKVNIESPKGKTVSIPRRELFDIRMQLMAEDETEAESLISNLEKSDLRTNVYEGGFKTWECSLDLARLLLDRGPRKDLDDLCRVDHVIEV